MRENVNEEIKQISWLSQCWKQSRNDSEAWFRSQGQERCKGHDMAYKPNSNLAEIVMQPTEFDEVIYHLEYSSNSITKMPQLLPHLTEVFLSNNSLEAIPASIATCVGLSILDISGNDIKMLPNEIGACSNLTKLLLRNNPIQQLPDTLTNLKQLVELDVSNTLLKRLPPGLSQMKNLKMNHLGVTELNLQANLEILQLVGVPLIPNMGQDFISLEDILFFVSKYRYYGSYDRKFWEEGFSDCDQNKLGLLDKKSLQK